MDAKAGRRIKASAAELDLQLEIVIEMLVKGYTRVAILRHFKTEAEKNPGLVKSDRSIDHYISHARKEIKKRFKPERTALLAMAVTRLEDLYQKNYSIQDYRECRAVIDTMGKFTGVTAAEKLEITGKDGGNIKLETITGIIVE